MIINYNQYKRINIKDESDEIFKENTTKKNEEDEEDDNHLIDKDTPIIEHFTENEKPKEEECKTAGNSNNWAMFFIIGLFGVLGHIFSSIFYLGGSLGNPYYLLFLVTPFSFYPAWVMSSGSYIDENMGNCEPVVDEFVLFFPLVSFFTGFILEFLCYPLDTDLKQGCSISPKYAKLIKLWIYILLFTAIRMQKNRSTCKEYTSSGIKTTISKSNSTTKTTNSNKTIENFSNNTLLGYKENNNKNEIKIKSSNIINKENNNKNEIKIKSQNIIDKENNNKNEIKIKSPIVETFSNESKTVESSEVKTVEKVESENFYAFNLFLHSLNDTTIAIIGLFTLVNVLKIMNVMVKFPRKAPGIAKIILTIAFLPLRIFLTILKYLLKIPGLKDGFMLSIIHIFINLKNNTKSLNEQICVEKNSVKTISILILVITLNIIISIVLLGKEGRSNLKSKFRKDNIKAKFNKIKDDVKAKRDKIKDDVKAKRDKIKDDVKAKRDKIKADVKAKRDKIKADVKAKKKKE